MQRYGYGGKAGGGDQNSRRECHDAEHTAEKEDADQNERCRESNGSDAELIHREAERKEVDKSCDGEGDGENRRKLACAREHTEGVVHHHHGNRIEKHQKSVGNTAAKHLADEAALDKTVVRLKRENDRRQTRNEDLKQRQIFGVEGIRHHVFDRPHNVRGKREEDTADREEDDTKRLHKEERRCTLNVVDDLSALAYD